jgi:hypothetical protein
MKNLIFVSILALMTSFASAQDDDIPERGGMGTVTVILEPAGSEVYLDGEFLGKAPVEGKEFPSGRFDLMVIDQEQELVNVRFNVWADKLNEYKAKTVMPFGNLNVDTGNKKCDVYVDGDYADRTDGGPLLIRNLDAGDHLVQAKCGGKRNMEMLVPVPGEQTVDVIVNAKKRTIEVKEN